MIVDASGLLSLLNARSVPTTASALYTCTMVFDPDEDVFGPLAALSAVGRSMATGLRGGVGMSDASDALTMARGLASDGTLVVVDPTGIELSAAARVAEEARMHLPLSPRERKRSLLDTASLGSS